MSQSTVASDDLWHLLRTDEAERFSYSCDKKHGFGKRGYVATLLDADENRVTYYMLHEARFNRWPFDQITMEAWAERCARRRYLRLHSVSYGHAPCCFSHWIGWRCAHCKRRVVNEQN